MSAIVYIAAQFPKRSETFVYREVLALRKLGVCVKTVGVRPGCEEMGNPELEALKTDTIPVYGSGAGRLIRDIAAEGFSHPLRSGQTISRAVADALGQRDAGGVKGRMKVILQGFVSLALAARLRRLNPVLLHAHMAHVPTTFAMYTAGQLKIPFSFTGHAADLFRDRCLLEVKLARAAFVHCISHWHRDFYMSLCDRPEADFPVVRCGVDAEEFEAHHPADGEVRMLAVGRLVAKKGFDLLLEALADPGLAALPWRLTLVGDGPELTALKEQARRHPAAGKIEMTGARSNDEVRAMMSRTDLFVLPCRIDPQGDRDGIPVVLMEAMTAGAAVISGDIPSIRELIHSGKNGLLTPPGDLKKLVEALIQLCTSSTMRDRLIQEGRKTVEHEFSQRVNAERIQKNLIDRKLYVS